MYYTVILSYFCISCILYFHALVVHKTLHTLPGDIFFLTVTLCAHTCLFPCLFLFLFGSLQYLLLNIPQCGPALNHFLKVGLAFRMPGSLLRASAARLSNSPFSTLLQLQGRTPCSPELRRGLHPLVLPFAETTDGDVLGLMHYPLRNGDVVLVDTRRDSHQVRPRGSPIQYALRAAIEADWNSHTAANSSELLRTALDASSSLGGGSYERGSVRASKLQLEQYLLANVGSFADVWDSLARNRLLCGHETPALIAAERGAANNPGWGCCLWLQSQLLAELPGRREERRDLALAALDTPFWTLGAPLAEVQAAAQLSEVDDIRFLLRSLEHKARQKQGAPPLSAAAQAQQRALDLMDEVVRVAGDWDQSTPTVIAAINEAGLQDVLP